MNADGVVLEVGGALQHGALNALSAQSTAGFASLNISTMDGGSKLVLMISMFLGGSIGSTAGGVKIWRLLILMRLLHLTIHRAAMPRDAVAQARLGGRRLESEEIQNALCLVLVFIVLIVLSWLPFVVMGHDPLDALFEVVSATATRVPWKVPCTAFLLSARFTTHRSN